MIVKTEQDEIARFLGDASNMPGGSAERVCFVESADDVVALLADAHVRQIPVTIAGAGTGLSGACIPMGGTVLATSRMNRIRDINAQSMLVSVEPGVMLADLQREVEQLSLFYPPDPTERTCSIGGTIATNASGARTFKYGPTRDYIVELDVVLATGEQLHLVRNDNHAIDGRMSLTTTNGRAIDLVVPSYAMPAIKHAAGYFASPTMDSIDLFIG
ncbi:MAG: FAD-binding oxidoreductase, partial [bacterium]|nr:FAD-binding oxidoreductase [Candidatus Kapabacteria bacterium]